MCTNTGTTYDDIKGSFTWDAVQNNNDGLQNNNDIYQIGLAKCKYSGYAICDGAIRYFYAWGWDPNVVGCGGGMGRVAYPVNLGGADSATHSYNVERTSTQIEFWIDSVKKASIPSSSICWNSNSVAWSGETWDGGDQMGANAGAGSTQSIFSATYQSTIGGIWNSAAFSTCVNSGAHLGVYGCTRVSGSQVDVWTDRR